MMKSLKSTNELNPVCYRVTLPNIKPSLTGGLQSGLLTVKTFSISAFVFHEVKLTLLFCFSI